jgi:hypothetical protein
MIEHVFRSARVPRRLQRSLLGLRVFDALTEYLVDRGHSTTTVEQYVQSVEHFDGWLRRTRRPVGDIGEEVVGEFLLEHLYRCRCSMPACTTLFQVRAALRHRLVVLRRRGWIHLQVRRGKARRRVLTVPAPRSWGGRQQAQVL